MSTELLRKKHREYMKSYRRDHPEQVEKARLSARKWYLENKDRAKARKKRFYEENREQILASCKKWRERNKERKRKANAVWEKKNPERLRAYRMARKARQSPEARREKHLRLKYGMSIRDFDVLFEAQGRRCAICHCDKPAGKSSWHIDHDHVSGKVRGILCHGCNTAIGHLQEDVEILRNAIEYLSSDSHLPIEAVA